MQTCLAWASDAEIHRVTMANQARVADQQSLQSQSIGTMHPKSGGAGPKQDLSLKFLWWNIIIICRCSSRSLGTLGWEPYLCPPHFFHGESYCQMQRQNNSDIAAAGICMTFNADGIWKLFTGKSYSKRSYNSVPSLEHLLFVVCWTGTKSWRAKE